MANSNWQPNEKQNLFIATLRKADGELTLSELGEIAGVEFKSGTINPLVSKNLVVSEDKTFECDLVRKDNGKVVGSTKKTVKVYSLPKAE